MRERMPTVGYHLISALLTLLLEQTDGSPDRLPWLVTLDRKKEQEDEEPDPDHFPVQAWEDEAGGDKQSLAMLEKMKRAN